MRTPSRAGIFLAPAEPLPPTQVGDGPYECPDCGYRATKDMSHKQPGASMRDRVPCIPSYERAEERRRATKRAGDRRRYAERRALDSLAQGE